MCYCVDLVRVEQSVVRQMSGYIPESEILVKVAIVSCSCHAVLVKGRLELWSLPICFTSGRGDRTQDDTHSISFDIYRYCPRPLITVLTKISIQIHWCNDTANLTTHCEMHHWCLLRVTPTVS